MRNFFAVFAAASLMMTSIALAQPLSAGKPAGVRAAQYYEDNTPLILMGVGALAIVIALTASGGHSHNNNGNGAGSGGGTVVTPTTT